MLEGVVEFTLLPAYMGCYVDNVKMSAIWYRLGHILWLLVSNVQNV